jgi:hypothetical protein
MFNVFYIIMKFGPETLWIVLFPTQLFSLILDVYRNMYDCFTHNNYLRLVLVLVKNPNFHSMHIENCKE